MTQAMAEQQIIYCMTLCVSVHIQFNNNGTVSRYYIDLCNDLMQSSIAIALAGAHVHV